MAGIPWAGRVDARHGVAALCVVLGGVAATAMSLMAGGCTSVEGRAALQIGVAAVAAAHDGNGDGALDRAEVAAMVEGAFPPEARSGPGWNALRAWLIAGYMAQDLNGDGRLTLAELLRGPSAGASAVACGDTNGDGVTSAAEVAAGLGRCPAVALPLEDGPSYAPAENRTMG